MCSLIHLYEIAHAYVLPVSLTNTIMSFILLKFLNNLTIIVQPTISFTETVNFIANVAQTKLPEEEWPTSPEFRGLINSIN